MVTARVLERLRNPPRDALTASLTPQESPILGHLADGLTNRQIAEQMFLAEKTVKNYVSNLLTKLGMNHRTQAAVYAARLAERRLTSPDQRRRDLRSAGHKVTSTMWSASSDSSSRHVPYRDGQKH